MSNNYLGEIRMFAGTFAPVNWMLCQGQILGIGDYETLYTLIGTTYGGDGDTTFALPDLGSRIPMHQGRSSLGSSYALGTPGGLETVTLTSNQLPTHTHALAASSAAATSASPANAVPAAWSNGQFSTQTPTVDLRVDAYDSTGGSQPHENRSPYLAVNFIIATTGIYPQQN